MMLVVCLDYFNECCTYGFVHQLNVALDRGFGPPLELAWRPLCRHVYSSCECTVKLRRTHILKLEIGNVFDLSY